MKPVFTIFTILLAELSMTRTESVNVHCISVRWVSVFSCWALCSRDVGIRSNNLVAIHGTLDFGVLPFILRFYDYNVIESRRFLSV